MRLGRAAIGFLGMFGVLWKVWRWYIERGGLIIVRPDEPGASRFDPTVAAPDEPAREPDYSVVDLLREVRNFGSAMLSLVRGRWDR